ncbi:MAG: 2-succinyl-5-enolpyruvyl-6-hydroxy-3-cyclohexene-1-carboxylic-acid synthase [Myxococcota bacterium]
MDAAEREHRRATYAYALAFVDALAAHGVERVCVSPGSRSTPLCLAVGAIERASAGALRASVHLDERSAGFFALGAAKATGRPVALVCTSGTAAANYLPAVVEAHHAGVPLVVLTADRPPELRDRGAGQTIDQVGLYGSHVRWFHEVAVPGPGGPPPRHARTLAARAVAEATRRPRGPVHVNWPLREPLEPERSPLDARELLAAGASGAGPRTGRGAQAESDGGPRGDIAATRAAVALSARASAAAPASIELLARLAAECARGVLALGPSDDDVAREAAALAAASGWPLLAEPTSGARARVEGGTSVAHADLFLRDAGFARAHAPDVVVRIGRSPTSKPQRRWLEAAPPRALVLVDPDRAWNDASALATHWLDDEPGALCAAAAARLARDALPPRAADGFAADFARADAACARAIDDVLASAPQLGSPGVVRAIADALPDDAWLFASNSMAVRDVDAYWPLERAPRRVLACRGASGIDGVTSAALGAAAASGRRVCLLTGDLAFLHDVGGLVAAADLALDATIVVVNDDGGAIFSYLPIAAHAEHVDFDRWFRTRHGRDLAHACALAGARHARVDSAAALRERLAASFGERGVSVVEVAVDAAANLAQHRAIEAAALRALAAERFALGAGAGA